MCCVSSVAITLSTRDVCWSYSLREIRCGEGGWNDYFVLTVSFHSVSRIVLASTHKTFRTAGREVDAAQELCGQGHL